MKGSHFLAYFLAGVIPRLSMFAILFLLPRRISIFETGLFVLVTTVGEMLEMTSANWVRLFANSREAGQKRLRPLRFGRLLVISGAALAAALVVAVPVAVIVAPDHLIEFTIAVFVYVISFALLRFVLVIHQVTHNHAMFSRIELVRGILVLPAVLAATTMPGASFFEPAMALNMVTLTVAIIGLAASGPQLHRPRVIGRGYRTALRFGSPIIADTLLGFVIVYFERFVLNEFLGPSSVGIYAIAYALGRQPVEFVIGPLNNLTVPVLFATRAKEGDERAREIQSGISVTIFILCAGALTGIFLLRNQIADLLVKPEFQADTAWLMPMIAAATCLLMFKVFLYDNLFFMLDRNALKLKAIIPAAIGSAIGSYFLVHAFGLAGAAASALLATALALTTSVIATRTFFRFRLPLADFARIAGVVAVAGAALYGAERWASGWGSTVEIIVGFVVFSAVYAAGLTLLGVSLRRLLSTPWEPFGSPLRQ